jgi:hypothetical protein
MGVRALKPVTVGTYEPARNLPALNTPPNAMPTANPDFEVMTTLQDAGLETGNLLPLYPYLHALDLGRPWPEMASNRFTSTIRTNENS